MKAYENEFSIHKFGKTVLLLGFAGLYGYLLWSGRATKYVHPRMIPYMGFAVIIFVLMALCMAREIYEKQGDTGSLQTLLFFFIPLLTMISIPSVSMEAGIRDRNGGLQISSVGGSGEAPMVQEETQQETPWIQNGTIVLENPNYYECLNDIYVNMEQYQEMTIETVGFVFRDNMLFGEQQFVPARLLMICCAADMAPIGLLCDYSQAGTLEENSWVTVRGVLSKMEYDGEVVPMITVREVEGTERPEQEYIYPY